MCPSDRQDTVCVSVGGACPPAQVSLSAVIAVVKLFGQLFPAQFSPRGHVC